MAELLKYLNNMLEQAVANARLPSGQNPLQQLVLIIADGRFHDNKEKVKRFMRDLLNRNCMVAFIVLDSAQESIVDCKVFFPSCFLCSSTIFYPSLPRKVLFSSLSFTLFTKEGYMFLTISFPFFSIKDYIFKNGILQKAVPYLDSFPFPYYIVLRNIEVLPRTLADLMRQVYPSL